jgi:ABC-type antimicrobial peptide transport system permease subunit
VDPEVAVAMETTMATLVGDSTLTERYRTLLVMLFGGGATLLAAVGIFGITARSVAGRGRELGIRIALGAEDRGLVGMVLRDNLMTALAGIVAGILGALGLSRLLTGLLFGVEPMDPLTFGVAGSFLVGVSLLAGYLPTRRIARTDPVEVLKAE